MPIKEDIATLVILLQRIVDESGRPDVFDAHTWLNEWLVELVPALGGRRPLDVLSDPEGMAAVKDVLSQMQSGAYA